MMLQNLISMQTVHLWRQKLLMHTIIGDIIKDTKSFFYFIQLELKLNHTIKK